MKLEHIKEPRLQFASGEHVCPRRGISAYGVFDKSQQSRRDSLMIGAVGSPACLEACSVWLEKCAAEIPARPDNNQPNLFTSFCGFNERTGFGAKFVFGDNLARAIKKTEIDELLDVKAWKDRVLAAVNLYYENVKFLAQNRNVDVIVCVIPEALYKSIVLEKKPNIDESLDTSVDVTGELNFRRALKAKAMHLGKPLQLVRAYSFETHRGQQDDATKAWNFCTALYYKSGPSIPWKLPVDTGRPTSCAVGIAFYRSRDYQSLNTSLAQIFDELGNGLILRGTPIELDKDDRIPHLSSQQAHDLLVSALNEYRIALRNYPGRVVVHKTSNFTLAEIDGLKQAAHELRIDALDFVTILDSNLRLFRNGEYPPYRGTKIELDEKRHLFYTRGAVQYYRTYTGLYVPQPIELRIVRSDESPTFIAKEVMGLTKMNWNNTQFDGKYPVTLGCARKVGEVLKYLGEHEAPQIRYGYYM